MSAKDRRMGCFEGVDYSLDVAFVPLPLTPASLRVQCFKNNSGLKSH